MTGLATARLLAAVGSASAVLAITGAPTAIAAPSNLVCSDGEMAMDSTCVPATGMDTMSDSLGLPDSSVGDVSDFSPGDFTPDGAPSEDYLSERGYGSQP